MGDVPVTMGMRGPVALMVLDYGRVNALDNEAIDSLRRTLDDAEQQAEAVVLAGRPGFFCGGVDTSVLAFDRRAVDDLLERYNDLILQLVGFPRPLVAACTGHAVGAGAALLLCCDVRIGAAGDFKIGFNEVAVGLPLYDLHYELARARLSPRYLALACNTAQIYTPDQAARVGFLDSATTEDPVEQACGTAAGLAQHLDTVAFAATRSVTSHQLTADLKRVDTSHRRYRRSIGTLERTFQPHRR